MKPHWAAKYIGRTPEEVGMCWGLLRLIYADFEIEVPEVKGISKENALAVANGVRDSISQDWEEIPKPIEGCAVGMNLRDNGEIHHVGVYTEGMVIHSWGAHRVIADTLRGLGMKGFKVIKFYKHKSWQS